MPNTFIEGEIERRHFNSASEFEQHLKHAHTPVILTGQMDQWPAFRRWDLNHFDKAYGQVHLSVSVDLLDRGAVYDQPDSRHARAMKLTDIVQLIEEPGARPCYTHQRPIQLFPGAEREVLFETIVKSQSGPTPSVNVWIGSKGTRSGLHFDRRDNLLAQIQGEKTVLICPPAEGSRLYPFPGNIEKSRIDIEHPDFAKFPRLRHSRFQQARLQKGELLFIPRMWWHFVRSLEPSLSINYWFGPKAPLREECAAIASAGPQSWLTLGRDFIWHGLLGKKHVGHLHTGRPTGALYFDQTLGWRFKR